MYKPIICQVCQEIDNSYLLCVFLTNAHPVAATSAIDHMHFNHNDMLCGDTHACPRHKVVVHVLHVHLLSICMKCPILILCIHVGNETYLIQVCSMIVHGHRHDFQGERRGEGVVTVHQPW